jgi:hypothetical protein
VVRGRDSQRRRAPRGAPGLRGLEGDTYTETLAAKEAACLSHGLDLPYVIRSLDPVASPRPTRCANSFGGQRINTPRQRPNAFDIVALTGDVLRCAHEGTDLAARKSAVGKVA